MAAKKPVTKKTPVDTHPVMAMKLWDVEKLSNDPRNARVHDEASIDAIQASLARFGQRKPIVVTPDGVVKAGNGTLEAARRLKWKQVAGAPAPKSKVEATAYALADNRTAEKSTWDSMILAEELRAIQAAGAVIDGLGWNPDELIELLRVQTEPTAPPEFPIFDLDVTVNCKCPKCAYEWSVAKPGSAKQAAAAGG